MATLSLRDLEQGRSTLRASLKPLAKKCTFGPAIQIWQENADTYSILVSTYPSPFTIVQAKFAISPFGKAKKIPFERKPNVYPWASLTQVQIEEWMDVLLQPKRKEFCKDFCAKIKRDLAAAVWHPRRVEKWVEAGIQLEDL
jgi:hypothetical protein